MDSFENRVDTLVVDYDGEEEALFMFNPDNKQGFTWCLVSGEDQAVKAGNALGVTEHVAKAAAEKACPFPI